MATIAIRCKAGFTTGMGHVYRQLHLAKVLRKRGIKIRFFVSDHSPSIDLLKANGFAVEIVGKEEGLPGATEDGFDLVVLDLQDTTREFISALRQRAKKIVSFENLGAGRNFVDLLVDCNLDPKESLTIASGVRPLFGLAYSVLAVEFGDYHRQQRTFPPVLKSLLVTMGGTDPNGLTLKLAEVFRQGRTKMAITFIVGPGFKETEPLKALAEPMPSVHILSNAGNMAELLCNHDAVFCSGGVTLHEALAVGTPAFVINQVPHQQEKTQPIERLKAAIDLGLPEDFDPQKISRILDISKSQLESMSRKGKELVDGKGIVRVADEIQSLITTS
jgi:UDP-2,4-diacetamido-2,4,6-trideoxy-beta-L-altropyranose hydrolase